jgi:flagellar M-ring protein FliF
VVEVVNTQFARAAPAAGAGEPVMFAFLGDLDVMRIIEIAAALIASLAFVFFVLRPLITGLVRGGGAAALAAGAPPAPALTGPTGAAALPPAEEPEPVIDIAQIQGRVRASSVKKVAEVVEKQPDESVQIIRGWLNNAF